MIVAVGAHSRKIGKTSIVCAILRGTPEIRWTAVKISSNRRGLAGGFEVFEETELGTQGDTARYLEAGAARACRLRAADLDMDAAGAHVRSLAASGCHLIVESNRIVEHVQPDLYLLALDFSVADFKDSARRSFARADAYLPVRSPAARPAWDDFPIDLLRRKPTYEVVPPDYRPRGLIREIRDRFGLPVTREAAA